MKNSQEPSYQFFCQLINDKTHILRLFTHTNEWKEELLLTRFTYIWIYWFITSDGCTSYVKFVNKLEFPYVPFFSWAVLFLKEMSRCPKNLCQDGQVSLFLIG